MKNSQEGSVRLVIALVAVILLGVVFYLSQPQSVVDAFHDFKIMFDHSLGK